jgi:homoserine dehydrogenase
LLSGRSRELHQRGLDFRVVAAVDSKGAAINSAGLDTTDLMAQKRKTGGIGDSGKSATDVIREVDADAVVELTPGTVDGEPALSHINAALTSSKSVVTANKMPLALHYVELMQEAKRRGVKLLYSACVGGGLPVLEFGRDCATAEPVDRIEGVLNATTNFVLTKMEQGETYERALKEAQKLGYAETDPSFDVDGLDSACKIVILANHVMGTDFRFRDVKPLRGISRITPAKVQKARGRGRALRLVARAGKSVSVSAAEIARGSPLAARGRSHAVVFHCRYSGERTIMGIGAGGVTTSIGVLRDLITLAGRTVA